VATPETPELDKLKKINASGDNKTIGAFLEWAGENGYRLTKTVEYTDVRHSLYNDDAYEVPIEVQEPVGTEEVLAAYFGIDMDKVSAEKDALYEALVAQTQPSKD
jgi:hypothetical protein